MKREEQCRAANDKDKRATGVFEILRQAASVGTLFCLLETSINSRNDDRRRQDLDEMG